MCDVTHNGNDEITCILYFYQGVTFDIFLHFHMDNKGMFVIIIKLTITLKLQTSLTAFHLSI